MGKEIQKSKGGKWVRGYFGIGIENSKKDTNIGTLWRSAYSLGASFIFTIGRKYKHQCSDTCSAWKHIPLYSYKDFDEFYASIPTDCKLVGIEIDTYSKDIKTYNHFERCIYLLGVEDFGLSKKAQCDCVDVICLPGKYCLNVSVAGSIVMYDRINKLEETG